MSVPPGNRPPWEDQQPPATPGAPPPWPPTPHTSHTPAAPGWAPQPPASSPPPPPWAQQPTEGGAAQPDWQQPPSWDTPPHTGAAPQPPDWGQHAPQGAPPQPGWDPTATATAAQPAPGKLQPTPEYSGATAPVAAAPGKRSGRRRPALIGIALLAIIAVAVTTTILVLHHRGNDNTAAVTSDIASANDTGPVTIITEDPTCTEYTRIVSSQVSQYGDWANRDISIPASAWTPQQRGAYDSAAAMLRSEANQLVPLARQTPHRVMRELYELIIAYNRAYADAIPTYVPANNALVSAANTAGAAATRICDSISYSSASGAAPKVPTVAGPTTLAPVGDLDNPTRFLTESNAVCNQWSALTNQFHEDSTRLATSDTTTPASQWTPEVRAAWDAKAQMVTTYPDQFEELGRKSGNPVWEDFAVLGAQYLRGFVAAIPTYTSPDSYLRTVAVSTQGLVQAACEVVGD